VKTKEQICEEINYQHKKLYEAQTASNSVLELEIRNIINTLEWVIKPAHLSAESRGE
jgi:hypothetical protein